MLGSPRSISTRETGINIVLTQGSRKFNATPLLPIRVHLGAEYNAAGVAVSGRPTSYVCSGIKVDFPIVSSFVSVQHIRRC